MREIRCDECGVLGALKYNLKLTESCCAERGNGASADGWNPCSQFASLQAQAQEVERTLLTLRAAQQSLISTDNHSPFIRDIPNEVVCIIFGFCHDPVTPKHSDSEESQSQTRRFCMLTLGAVCKKWREIAWAIPELWTSLLMPDVPESASSSESFSLQVELAKEWLSRAAKLPLSISLETPGQRKYSSEFNFDVGRLINFLNSYSRQWQCLDICIAMMYLSLFNNLPSETAQNEQERFQHLQLDGFGFHS